jgi:hypothetical protein
MSKRALSLVVVMFTLSGQASANVASDCSYLEGKQAPAGMCNRIQEAAANLNQFQPPQPCASKEEKTFTFGAPADVCDSGGGGSGGGGGIGTFQ